MHEITQLYKALSDETRLRILALLFSEGELCVCDIIAALNLPQSTISRHLAQLRKAGWVSDRRCGLWIYYSVQRGDAFQAELTPLLEKHLLQSTTAKADREKLASLASDNRCA